MQGPGTLRTSAVHGQEMLRTSPRKKKMHGKGPYTLGRGETSWNRQQIWAEPDLVAFHI